MGLETGQGKEVVHEIPKEGTVDYRLDAGVNVEVKYKRFDSLSQNEHADKPRLDATVVFLPGWKMPNEDETVANMCKTFASDVTGGAYAVTTRSHERGTVDETYDVLHEEARAIGRLLHEHGKKRLIIAGHSQGADKAVHLVSILQQDHDVEVEGLIEMAPVGMYEQDGKALTGRFLADVAVNTPVRFVERIAKAAIGKFKYHDDSDESIPQAAHSIGKTVQTAADAIAVGGTVLNEVSKGISSPLRTKRFITSEVQEMAKKNPYLEQIRVPVIVVTGKYDAISQASKIAPSDNRTEDLKKVFPNSPHLKMVESTKEGYHAGALVRTSNIEEGRVTGAHAAIGLLERYRRTKSEKIG